MEPNDQISQGSHDIPGGMVFIIGLLFNLAIQGLREDILASEGPV
jgi:hypothetical protein